jgi:hypothetical protein
MHTWKDRSMHNTNQAHPWARRAATLTLLFLLVLLLLVLAAVGSAIGQGQSMRYPSATLISQHSRTNVSNSIYLRQDASYRTSDAFPVVYNWYSTGFRLGPESHAQGSCIMMEKGSTMLWLFQTHIGVTVCDTRSSRMIYIKRILSINLP